MRAPRLVVSLLLALGAAAACGRARPAGTLARERCRDVDVPGARCSSLTVYENRAARTGRTIRLRIVVLPARQQPRAVDAIFFLAGGPGEAATHMASADFVVNHPLRAHRDIVLVDQRGTGGSHDLRCRFYGHGLRGDAPTGNPQGHGLRADAPTGNPQGYGLRGDAPTGNPQGPPSDVQSYFGPFIPPDKARACREELSRDADLTQYTTANSVEDLEEVRASLRYSQVDLIGLSYGTRLAMEYVRAHEPRVRTVVLYGAVPPSEPMPQRFGAMAQRALDGLLAECAATPACRAAFPSIRDEARAVFDRLRQSPVKTTFTVDGRPATVTLSRDIVAESIRYMTYSSGQASSVPLFLHRAAQGDFSPIAADIWRRRQDGTFDGLYLAITCAEDVPFVSAAAAEDDDPTYLGGHRVRQQRAGCDGWPSGAEPAWRNKPVAANVPVLFVSGTLDPVTPAAFADEIRRTLPNNARLLVRSGGHNLDGLTHPECLDRIEQAFVERGSVAGLDTSCVTRMARPGFATR